MCVMLFIGGGFFEEGLDWIMVFGKSFEMNLEIKR